MDLIRRRSVGVCEERGPRAVVYHDLTMVRVVDRHVKGQFRSIGGPAEVTDVSLIAKKGFSIFALRST
jgi:hypothetical protein